MLSQSSAHLLGLVAIRAGAAVAVGSRTHIHLREKDIPDER
jgi:hypothetical protein